MTINRGFIADSTALSSSGCLVYCIVAAQPEYASLLPIGIGGEPVFAIEEGGLSAVVTRWQDGAAVRSPEVAQILAYEQVVESVFQFQAVLPMRYGCLLNGEVEVVELLRQHREEYMGSLRELAGCVEMGIRFVVNLPPESAPKTGEIEMTDPAVASGQDFLRRRRRHYAAADLLAERWEPVVERCRTAFAGLFCRSQADPPVLRQHRVLASVNFLVYKRDMEAFRRAFDEFARWEAASMLLSGPWPPYNFVSRRATKNEMSLLSEQRR